MGQLQPYSVTDLAAMVLGLLALLYAAIWWRDREQGMPWLAVSFALAASWYATMNRHLPDGPTFGADQRGWALVLLAASMALTVGIMRYLAPLAGRRRWVLAALLLPGLLVSAALLLGWPVRRPLVSGVALVGYLSGGAVAFYSARREPGAGHGFIAAALFAAPLLVIVPAWVLSGFHHLRYWGVLPALFVGLTLLTVGLLRRRRALEDEITRRAALELELTRLNATLEQRVSDRTADLQQLVVGLESFNRNVSHDLRGPLGGIAGLAQLAQEAVARGDMSMVARALPAIAAQAETSHRLVDALLQLARVSEGTLQRAPVDLRALAEEVWRQIEQTAPSGQALPAFELGALPEVEADADLLRPVLMNLVGNAVKFTRESATPRIEVSGHSTPQEVVVCVRDNGVGFEAQVADRLFQPFKRLHDKRFEGSGVGLSIVRRAIERHGGRVWAEAAPLRGAAFYFSLPRQRAAA